MTTYAKFSERTLRLLLVFDPPALRGSLEDLLGSHGGIDVVGSMPNNAEAIDIAGETQPDLVIIQIDSALDLAKKTLARMKAASPESRILAVTDVEEPEYASALLDFGASAYITKSIHLNALIETVRDVVRNPELLEDGSLSVPTEAVENTKDGYHQVISERQLEVLLLAARGLSNRQIAASLNLSEATISRHLANVYSRMNVSSRSEASKMAMSKGWISLVDITA